MSFNSFGLIQRASATQPTQISQPLDNPIDKSKENGELLSLVNNGDGIVIAKHLQSKEPHNHKKYKEETPKEPIPSSFVPEQ